MSSLSLSWMVLLRSKIIIVNIPPVVSTRQGISCLGYCGEVSSLPRKVGEHCRVEGQGQWEDRWGIVNSQAEFRILYLLLPESSRYNKPWSSYPPPVPLWAITKPRRDYLPFFGYHSSSNHHPPSTSTTSTTSNTSPPSTTSSPIPSSTDSTVTCRPDPVSDNLP